MKLTTLWPVFGLLIAVSALPQNARSSATTSRKSKHEKNKFGYTQFGETDPEYWYGQAAADIRERLDILRPLHKRAKNVVFFLGDGMGISTITAARIFKGQIAGQRGEEGYLEMDHFPYSALIKTYNLDKQVPDSAGTATAYLTGVKANFATIGVSAKVNEHSMDCDLINASSVNSILHWALDAGKAAGVVTTTRITHATPAASYAHVPQRDWEGSVPGQVQGLPGCKDIAAQLVEEYPGNRLSVILGGGRREFIPEDQFDPKGALRRGRLVPVKGNRKDGRNLIDKWIKDKSQMPGLDKSEYAFVNNTAGLAGVDFGKVKYLFGLFNHSHMEYDQLRDKGPNGEPSLTQMTEAAIRVLKAQKPDNGFVLLVEGGRIDHAHHDGYANLALYETLELDRAIRRARELLPPEDTLILVTADHSHGLTINGYPARGNPINGWAGEDEDHIPFTTLMYSNGPGHMSHEERENRVIDDTNYVKYRVHAAVHTADTNHAGEDVAVFGTGPMAHFFGGTHEQSYIAHVVGYAACIGVYRNESHCPGAPESLDPHHRPAKPELEREWEEEEEENTIVIKEPGRRQGDATSRSLRLTKAEGRSGATSRMMATTASDRTLTSLQIFTVILSTSWILFFRD